MTNFLWHRFNTELRGRIGDMSLRHAAEASSVADSTLRRIIKRGNTRNTMSLRVFIQLCDWIDTDPRDFFLTRNESGEDLDKSALVKHAIMECTDIPMAKREAFVKIFEALSRGE